MVRFDTRPNNKCWVRTALSYIQGIVKSKLIGELYTQFIVKSSTKGFEWSELKLEIEIMMIWKINRERSVYKSLTGCLEIGAMTISLKKQR
jgi:hypothetical protein